MKIVQIRVKNFLKLQDVELNPKHTTVIQGKNKQGKTSILKAIETAFDGKLDQSAIRIGADKAVIEVDLEQFSVHRSITPAGNNLTVKNHDGFIIPSPQKFLNGLVGEFSFNPIEFFEMKPADRKKYLLSAIDMKLTAEQLTEMTGMNLLGVPLDFSKHALEVIADAHKYFYDQRTTVNGSVTKKLKSIEQIQSEIPEGFDASAVSDAKIAELRTAITNSAVAKTQLEQRDNNVRRLTNEADNIRGEIAQLETKLKATLQSIEEENAREFVIAETGDLELQLKQLEIGKETGFKVKQVSDMREELKTEQEQQTRLDTTVKKLAKDIPDALLAQAKLPIDGLVIEGDSIKINGVELDNLSSSEQLRFGLAIVKSLNNKFRIVCIDGLEALDRETCEWFLKEIADDDFQYFMTRVDGDNNDAITIEDGRIKSDATENPASEAVS